MVYDSSRPIATPPINNLLPPPLFLPASRLGHDLGQVHGDGFAVRLGHRAKAKLLEHSLPARDAHPLAHVSVDGELLDGVEERGGVAGLDEDALDAVAERLRDAVDARRNHGALERHRLADHQRQHLVDAGAQDHVGREVVRQHVLLHVEDRRGRLRADALQRLLALLDVVYLVLADVPRADHQQLELPVVRERHRRVQLREGLTRHQLRLALAHRPHVHEEEVARAVPEVLAHTVPTLLGAERVDAGQRDAVVDDARVVGLEQAVVAPALHLGGEDDLGRVGKRVPDGLLVQVGHHEDLLCVVVELVLGPRLMDDPQARDVQVARRVDDLGGHDGVGDGVLEVLQQHAHVVRVRRQLHAEDGDRDAHGLVVGAHRALLGRDQVERQLLAQLAQQVEQEVVGAVALQRVAEGGHARARQVGGAVKEAVGVLGGGREDVRALEDADFLRLQHRVLDPAEDVLDGVFRYVVLFRKLEQGAGALGLCTHGNLLVLLLKLGLHAAKHVADDLVGVGLCLLEAGVEVEVVLFELGEVLSLFDLRGGDAAGLAALLEPEAPGGVLEAQTVVEDVLDLGEDAPCLAQLLLVLGLVEVGLEVELLVRDGARRKLEGDVDGLLEGAHALHGACGRLEHGARRVSRCGARRGAAVVM